MKFLNIILFVILLRISLFSQIYFIDYNPSIEPEILEKIINGSFEIYDSLKSYDALLHLSIVEAGNRKYLMPDGSFDVYLWNDNRWIQVYKFNNNGYNFNSSKFVYRDEIYSYGGYGFWRGHGDLIKFNFHKGEWELIKYNDDNREGLGNSYYFNGNLYVINPEKFVDLYPSSRIESKNFRIELSSMKKYIYLRQINKKIIKSYETENFVIFYNNVTYIMDKRSGNLYCDDFEIFSSKHELNKINKLFYYINNDIVSIIDSKGNIKAKYIIENVLKSFNLVKDNNNNNLYLLILLIVFVVALFAWIYFYIKKNSTEYENKSIHFSQFTMQINALLDLNHNVITSDQLDNILKISMIKSAETLRYKRAEMINSINLEMKSKTGQPLINRVKDPNDRRKFLYKINEMPS